MKKSISIPDDLAISLAAYAMQLETTEDELICKAIDHYLKTVVRKWPNSIGMVSDGSLQAEDIEDWINEHWLKDIMGETEETSETGDTPKR